MSEPYTNNPYLILGVHRSGTTLMSEIFSETGIWMGKNQNIHKEAEFFFNLNNKILKENNSNAYDFEPILKKLNDNGFIDMQAEHIQKYVQNKLPQKFFGIFRFLKYRFKKQELKWGFKDPRTVLILPVWMKVFPQAKLLIILRNPVDVSMSIYYFEQKRWKKKLTKQPDLKFGMPLTRAFGIWKNFTKLLLATAERYPDNSLIIKYEELGRPKVIKNIIDFTDTSTKPDKIKKMIIDKPSNYPKPDTYNELLKLVKSDELSQKLYTDLNT